LTQPCRPDPPGLQAGSKLRGWVNNDGQISQVEIIQFASGVERACKCWGMIFDLSIRQASISKNPLASVDDRPADNKIFARGLRKNYLQKMEFLRACRKHFISAHSNGFEKWAGECGMAESQGNGSATNAAASLNQIRSGTALHASGPVVSLVIPAYNEQDTIVQAICEAEEALAGLVDNFEILIVDDGSTDATVEIVSREAKQRPRVKLLEQPDNLGYGAALRRGFAEANAPLVGFTDADCQFDLRELDRLLLLSKDYDIVCGYRIERNEGWRRNATSKTYNLLARALFGVCVRDCDCALKLFRKEFLASSPIETNGFFVNVELLAKARLTQASIVEVGVTHRPRAAGESKVSIRQVYPVASSMLRFWWSNRFAPASCEQDPASSGAWSSRIELGFMSLLIVAAMFLLFGRLGYTLIEPDETRYAQIASEMIKSDDWVTPTLVGRPYLDKPPLLYWATAISYDLFGMNEWSARFPCTLSVFLTLLATYYLGKRIVGSRAACFGAASLLMCGGFVLSGRFIFMDGPLSLFTTITLLAGYLACCGTELRVGWWIVTALACALGILTKGPIALLLCVPPLVAVRWLSNSLCQIQLRHWALLVAVMLLVTMPWFAAVAAFNGEFLSYFLWKHHVVRFVNSFHHQEPWWFYLPVMLAGTFPASLLFPGLVPFLRSRRTVDAPRNSQATGYFLLCTVWVVFFFSLSSCKLAMYVLPAFPPLCLVLGMMLDQLIFAERKQFSVSPGFQWIPKRLAFSSVAMAVLAVIVERIVFHQVQLGAVFYALTLIASGTLVFVVWKTATQRVNVAWASSIAFSVCVMGFIYFLFVPALSETRSVHAKAAALQRLHRTTPVIYFNHQAYSATFELDEANVHHFQFNELAEAGEFLQQHPEAILVTIPKSAEKLTREFGSRVELRSADSCGRLFMSRARTLPESRVSASPPAKVR
jgi:4-amino-4-deoxy-L-arabinose transferase-like glycosyltransferase